MWWGQNAFDELIEKATSELLPANQEDVALQFMISDQIRSKKVNAKDAMRALKRRLEHKNPNVQNATLSLTDTCVKNGGDQFVREIASREFMEAISFLVHSQVRWEHSIILRALTILQTWALAAKNTPSLSYLTDTYNLFRAEGIVFPEPQELVNSFLLETIAHHCRNCGGTFCQECSSKSLPLPHMAIDEAVRVCYGCYIKLKLSRVAKKEGPLPPYPGAPQQQQQQHQATSSSSTTAAQNDDDKQFEEDLKKALELSKKEAEQSGPYGHGYVSTTASAPANDKKAASNWEPAPASNKQQEEEEEEEDPELAAAIAASLKDMEDAQKSTLEFYSNQKTTARINSDEMSPVEMENIELFSLLMHRINDTGNNIANDEQINRLYTQIGTLQPKLVRNLDEASRKHKKFAELHEKLNMSVKAYDQLLQQRVSNSYYNRAPSLSTGAQSFYSSHYPTTPVSKTPQPQNYYPAQQQQQQPYPQIPQQQPAMYPAAPTHIPTSTPTQPPQQQQQQPKPIDEAPLIEL
ncbi:hypothetical protein BDB00DRAFT_767657 [Zychaea mexicana]|uniref:uncharacterized protein n=1 Tax=Zychaea mexicana TaxID=64656 RepID=UPI0022FDC029|nr:uncharacterized protein BDB00DRAFT_767657 [Zychaea mexicana]KAI9491158.1 hypothetical protein BDB00DRAFT_767657 [Zychaea mexicana]